MSLPKWVQEAVEKGQELYVCLELWRHATAVERDDRAVKREEKKQEIELRLAMERDVQDKKQALQREMKKKKVTGTNERIRFTGTSNESPKETG